MVGQSSGSMERTVSLDQALDSTLVAATAQRIAPAER
jgi:hypothetical protein